MLGVTDRRVGVVVQSPIVKKLLDCGANVEVADKEGRTPFEIAMKHGSKGMVLGGDKLIELMKTRLPVAAPDSEVRDADSLPRPKNI